MSLVDLTACFTTWQIVSLSNFTHRTPRRVGYSFAVMRMRARALVVAALATVSAVTVRGQRTKEPPIDLVGLLERVGERVEAYYQRAQSIVCTETVQLVTMDTSFVSNPHTRRLVYELRVSWDKAGDGDATPEANVLRQLKLVDGRAPKAGEEPGCLDPKPVSLDPLSFLLPHHQREYKFTYKGIGKTGDGRTAVMIDYAPTGKPPAEIKWKESCVEINVPARTTGRAWIDRFGGDVLRIDETVMGPFDVEVPESQRRKGANSNLILDRADSSIRYKMVTFTEPNEVVLLPESIELMSVIRGAGSPRLRTTQRFTGYQRFVTGGRVVTP